LIDLNPKVLKIIPPAPFLLKKETHNKNKENHLKEVDEIFRMVWFAYVNFNKNITRNYVKATRAEPPLPKD
jgi:hypothetical protein